MDLILALFSVENNRRERKGESTWPAKGWPNPITSSCQGRTDRGGKAKFHTVVQWKLWPRTLQAGGLLPCSNEFKI